MNELKKPQNTENEAVRTHWLGALYWAFRNPSFWHIAGKQGFVQEKQLNIVLTWSSWKYSDISVQKEYTELPTVRNTAMNSTPNCVQQTSEDYCQLWAKEQWTVLSTVRNRAMNNSANCAQHSNEQ
jgi:hypothetical protein